MKQTLSKAISYGADFNNIYIISVSGIQQGINLIYQVIASKCPFSSAATLINSFLSNIIGAINIGDFDHNLAMFSEMFKSNSQSNEFLRAKSTFPVQLSDTKSPTKSPIYSPTKSPLNPTKAPSFKPSKAPTKAPIKKVIDTVEELVFNTSRRFF
jgi:hypothetical protein